MVRWLAPGACWPLALSLKKKACMIRWTHLVRARTLAWLLALFSISAPPLTNAQAAPSPSLPGTYQHIHIVADGAFTLSPSAPPAPAIYGSFSHFGIALPAAQQSSFFFQAVQVRYSADVPAGSELRFDVRASADGQRWTEWELGLANGSRATFARPVRWAQYRATLLGNSHALPSVRDIAIAPERGSALFSAMGEEPVAPTWKLRATRMGMVGGHTANGHRITKRDHFVSLPSWRALSPEGTNQYTVRITYNGRSSVAPVYDVGPWNAHDDYWNVDRERFKDLPQGWPEDHAAYYDGYNNGRAEKGRVRFPTAVDIGDGVWWDDLGIKGDQATVEITFLWMGRDPLAEPPPPPAPPAEAAPAPAPPPEQAAPPPAPPAEAAPAPPPPPEQAAPPAPPAEAAPPPPPPAEIVLDTKNGGFHAQAAIKWYEGPKGCGTNGAALWTYSTANAAESENSAVWQPGLPDEALYDVYVNIPICNSKKPATASARYLVRHRDGTQEIVIDQSKVAGQWVLLGRFPFSAGDGGSVELRDVTGDSMRTIWFDAVKWVRAP